MPLPIDRRRFLQAGALGLASASFVSPAQAAAEGETLYNGIRLPASWPPRPTEIPRDPITPPYLVKPPAVIPIDVGRQLFVDDFLIERTDLKRSYHHPEYHSDSPVLKPDQPWEKPRSNGMAMVFSDGVWYDPKDQLFKAWYIGGSIQTTCLAVSEDGLRWKKLTYDVRKGTNVVQTDTRDSSTVWLDLEETDPRRRYKMFRSYNYKGRFVLSVHFSADGIHWGDVVYRTGSCGDRTTVFRNPFRKVWVYSLRHGWGLPRKRRYWEVRDLVAGPQWDRIDQPPLWTGADRLDPPRKDLKITPQLYNLDCVAYESVVLGLFSIWRGHPANRQKINEIVPGYSRDGWHWHRPDRSAFCPVSEKPHVWNYSNVQSAGGCCLVVGDKLYFYVSGRSSTQNGNGSGTCTTGLAVLRRDGFASLDAGERAGTITTRALRFRGKHLFVNVQNNEGELRVEVLDERGQVIAPFTHDKCVPVSADRTRQKVEWKGVKDLSALAGKVVKLRFTLKGGRLFAFWVSPDASGASHGYVAAGGPGFKGLMDTVGSTY